jgi:hypothetical protein
LGASLIQGLITMGNHTRFWVVFKRQESGGVLKYSMASS